MSTLSLAATVVTIMYFIAGTSSTRQFIRAKSTGSVSFIPFAATFCNCIFWLKYGILREDFSIISVNGFGAAMALFSCLVFYVYSENSTLGGNPKAGPVLVERISVIYGCWILFVLSVIKFGGPWISLTSRVSLMGWICSIMTVLMFGSPLVSLKYVPNTGDASVMNFPLTACGFLVGLLWSVYGIQLNDPFVYVTNGLGCLLSLLQLAVLFKFSGNGVSNSFKPTKSNDGRYSPLQ